MNKEQNKLYNLKEAAEYLGISERGIVSRAEVGRIKFQKREGNEYWFSLEDLKRYRKSKQAPRRAILVVGILLTCAIGGGAGMMAGGKYMRRQSSEKMLAAAVEDLKSGNLEKALHEMRSVVLAEPENSRARLEYAKALGMSGKLKEAEEQLRKALELQPDSIEALQNLGTLLFETGRVDEASGIFERALKGDGKNFMATYYLAAAQMREGRLEEAETTAMKLIEMRPGMKVAESLLADILSLRGKNDAALKAYGAAGSENLREKLNVAITLHKDGKFKEAEKIYKEIIGNEQIVARAYNNLAWEKVQNGRGSEGNLEEAFNLAARAAVLNPADAQAADTLGWILYLAGKSAEAEKIFIKALEMQPGQMDATMHLARIYIENNQKDKAIKILGAAQGTAKTEQDKAALLQLLNSIASK